MAAIPCIFPFRPGLTVVLSEQGPRRHGETMEMTCGSESGGDSLKEAAVSMVTVTRNGRLDMQHLGFACLVDAGGNRLWSLGDPHAHAFFRSSAKPLQALAMLASGVAETAGLDDRDL